MSKIIDSIMEGQGKMSKKIILDLCGGTGAWSQPYADAGYDVRVITLPKYDVCTYKIHTDIYGVLAAPPCDQLSFARTNAKKPRDLTKAINILKGCLRIIWDCQKRIVSDTQKYSPLKFWALENPNCMMKWYLGHPVFQFSPHEFGDAYKKNTHLWGWFKEPKKSPIDCTKPKFDRLLTREIHPEHYGTLNRTERRAITPQGFAKAFFEVNQ